MIRRDGRGMTKLLELTNNENVPTAGINSKRLIGKPINAIYVFQTDGVFQTQEEVDAYYEMYYWNAVKHVETDIIVDLTYTVAPVYFNLPTAGT